MFEAADFHMPQGKTDRVEGNSRFVAAATVFVSNQVGTKCKC